MDKCHDLLYTSINQFGFKRKHSTDMCVYVFKEIVNLYRKQSSPLFLAFVYASKAFDKIDHCILFKKLRIRGFPLVIIRLLEYWYSSQLVYVQWGGFLSSSFGVSNGVKQGGILSPVLFNIYMDELSLRLQKSNVGCNCNDSFINHLVYADDMVLIVPSAGALQTMLNICCGYSVTHIVLHIMKKKLLLCISNLLRLSLTTYLVSC